MPFCKDIIDIFFHRPRRTHPPAGHLPDDGIHPQKFFHFLFNVVALIDDGCLYDVSVRDQHTVGMVVQGLVQATLRVAELLTAIQ